VEDLPTDEGRVYSALPDLLGWQPSRFLTDRGEAERAFQLAARRLGSVRDEGRAPAFSRDVGFIRI